VAPTEGERPSKKRRVKTTLVVTPLKRLGAGRGKSRGVSTLVHSAFTRVVNRSESLVSRAWLQYDVILTAYQSVGGVLSKHMNGRGACFER